MTLSLSMVVSSLIYVMLVLMRCGCLVAMLVKYLFLSKLRVPMFWVAKLPALVKEESPIVFSRPLLGGGVGGGGWTKKGLGVPGKLTRSISQVSNISKPSRSNLKRSLSIVSSYSMRASPTASSSLRRNRRLHN